MPENSLKKPAPPKEAPLEEPPMPEVLLPEDFRQKMVKNREEVENFEKRVKSLREHK